MRRITTLILILSFVSFSLFSQQYNPGPRLMGFSAEGSSRERELESKFDAQLKADNLRDWMKRITSRPDHLGSPHNKENAEFIAFQVLGV